MGEVRVLPGPHGRDIEPHGGVAVVEMLERDGQVRSVHTVAAWPLRIGRALGNDLLLADPHVAPRHLQVDMAAEGGLVLQLGETFNGVHCGALHLRSGERAVLPDAGAPFEWTMGRSHLRLRLPQHPVAPELALAAATASSSRGVPTAVAGVLLLAALGFNTWLDNDPDGFARALGSMLLGALLGTAVWCGLWALLSKTFTRQGHFGWHLKVFLFASLGWLAAGALPGLVAFALSWPRVGDFGFVLSYAVAAAALYFHLLAVEPARPRLLRAVAAVALVVGVGLAMWFNQQRSGRLGAELYLNHLYPPGFRLARPVATDDFVDGLAALKPVLDRKALEPPQADGTGGSSDGEE